MKQTINQDFLKKIKKAGLVGRGGAGYPVWLKWQAVKDNFEKRRQVKAGRKHVIDEDMKCFVVCNFSEGEPDVKKDHYLLEQHPARIIDGIKIAMHYLGAEQGFIFINHHYYARLAHNLINHIGSFPIELFVKPEDAGYIGGEESAILNTIEGRKTEPRFRPPYPVESGLWGYPTLVNNVETFYNVSLLHANKYENKRFYTVTGDCLWDGVYCYPDNLTIEQVLKESGNYPKFEFFVQIGGGASGEVLNSKQLNQPATGAGSITIYSLPKHEPIALIRHWIKFFRQESCGQCTPCREGTYRLQEILRSKTPDWTLVADLLSNLKESSFCGLGSSVPIPISSYINNVLLNLTENEINLSNANRALICDCFK
jgi:NADH:ubiquinone oxidoreductase subunit F (NADH-binding)